MLRLLDVAWMRMGSSPVGATRCENVDKENALMLLWPKKQKAINSWMLVVVVVVVAAAATLHDLNPSARRRRRRRRSYKTEQRLSELVGRCRRRAKEC